MIGCPSDHLACRILNVQVSPSGEVVQDSARSGLGCSVFESGTVRYPYVQRWIDDDTSRTARNGFIESIDWVAPTLITLGLSGSAAWAGAVPTASSATAASPANHFLIRHAPLTRAAV